MEILLLFVFIICIAATVAIILFFVFQIIAIFTTDAPFVPIPNGIDNAIVENLKLTEGSILYDLGCGDARVLRHAVSRHPNIRAVGIEIAFIPYLIATFKTRNDKNILIKRENIFRTDVSNATCVFVYLFPGVLNKLVPKLMKDCAPGTRIVSCDFECSDIVPTEIIDIHDEQRKRGKKLVVYEVR